MKVLITGINGMLGSAIFKALSKDEEVEIYGVGRRVQTHKNLNHYFRGDLTNSNFIEKISSGINFDWIIHCAAIVDLKYCEDNPHIARSTHVTSTELLSRNNPKSKFIYISTDSIFDGRKGNYSEKDEPSPLNIYAKTKLQGERVIRESHLSYYILRLNIIGQNSSRGNSLFEWAYKSLDEGRDIDGYDNVIFNPLHVDQVSSILLKMIEVEPPFGIYNLGSLLPISKFEFIKRVAEENNLDTKLISSKTVDFSSSNISRPLNTSLNIEKLKSLSLGIDLTLNKHLKKTNSLMNTINIGNKTIGDNQPLYFIADIGANHDGDLNRAYKLIELAKESGADAAKFQNFKANKIVSKAGFERLGGQLSHQQKWKKSVYETYEDASLSDDWTQLLKEKCDEVGIDYFTSAYDFDSVDHADKFVDVYKIGSGDITWHKIIEYTAKKGKPVMMATGASDFEEVKKAMEVLEEYTDQIVLMQCNTNYTIDDDKYQYVNLNVLKAYKKHFPDVVLGLSDHTFGHATVLGSIALGARVFEKHFTDDNDREGPDHKFAMNPKTWKEMVINSNQLYSALGDGEKRVESNEEKSKIVQRRSLRVTKDLKKGQVIQKSDLEALRPLPTDGIDPYKIGDILGTTLSKDIKAGDHLTEGHITDDKR